MASYRLLIKRSAAKELESLPLGDRRRVVERIRKLAEHPRPRGVEKLGGQELFRVRQGSFRLLYEILDRDRIVTIIKVGHRRDVYR